MKAYLAEVDATGQAELVRRGELERGELLDACAARIERLDPLLHTIVTLDLERARSAPAVDGPFAGVPTLVKDVLPYPGLRWSVGSRMFASNVAAQQTAFGARIDASGLVTVGKSATSEFGLLGSTETLLEGVTHNPWDLSRSASGSSGGAAAAVAAGIVPIAHANDGGGSIRIPASVCGVFGLKPSKGRCVSATLAPSDFGDLTSDLCVSRSVRDTARFLAATEDPDGPFAPVGFVDRPIGRRLRIATWTTTLSGQEPEPDVRRAHAEAVAACEDLGHEIVAVRPPAIDGERLGDAFFLVAGATISGVVAMVGAMRGAPVRADELEPFTWALVQRARARGAVALDGARALFAEAARAYLDAVAPYDVVLTPTLATKPWRIGHLSPILPADELLRRTAESVQYTPIHNVAGCTAMSVPLSWSADGLPIGAHFAAKPGDEAVLLGLAYALEEARPWKDRWPPFSIPALAT